MEPMKINVIQTLQLLGNPSEQEAYAKSVPIAEVAAELVEQWFSDYFDPESNYCRSRFSEAEWEILIEFHRFFDERVEDLPSTYEKLKVHPVWKEIVKKAQWALTKLGWDDLHVRHEASEGQ